jgi:hypothetical protein
MRARRPVKNSTFYALPFHFFITEAVKESGKQFGKWMPRAFWMLVIERMLGVTETITVWLKMVFPAI